MAADPLTRSAVDDLFDPNFSDLEDDPFAERPPLQSTRDDKAVLSPRAGAKRKYNDQDKENLGLGLDEEVKIVKKRQPIAKLDEARLLSEPGIPKLRALSRSGHLLKKLRIKGKGHEFNDAARLLNHFQLWLDNLYPRAKFADALQLVEKAGHSKRMHIMRNEWINEGKPGYRRYEEQNTNVSHQEPDLFGPMVGESDQQGSKASGTTGTTKQHQDKVMTSGNDTDDEDAMFVPDSNQLARDGHDDDQPDEDELDALMAAHSNPQSITRASGHKDDSECEDDLDALLAERDSRRTPAQRNDVAEEDEEDDLDALLAEHDAQQNKPAEDSLHRGPSSEDDDDDDEEDDLEALLAHHRSTRLTSSASKPTTSTLDTQPALPTPQPTSTPPRHTSSTPTRPTPSNKSINHNNTTTNTVPFSSSPMPNNPEEMDLDDLEALLASQEAKQQPQQRQQEKKTSTPREERRFMDDITPKARKVRDAMESLLSSSPVPNEEEESQ